MIKEKLMSALKMAASDYNGGMNANAAVANAAQFEDLNEKQAERLAEMFNTLAAINQEKDASNPTGSCELADKGAVTKILLDSGVQKSASAPGVSDDSIYDFYSSTPSKTNLTIEARNAGMDSMMKAASAVEIEPSELDISQRSLYKVISGKIDFLKSAAEAADDVSRNMRLEADRCAIKIAKAIESPFADDSLADMFKAACDKPNAVKMVAEYSTKVAESNGGRYAALAVFDASQIEDLLKTAEEIEGYVSKVSDYDGKRDYYMSKASEAEDAMRKILGFAKKEAKASVADFFNPESMSKKAGDDATKPEENPAADDASLSVKIAQIIRKSGISAEEVARLAEDLEKDAAPRMNALVQVPTVQESYDALSKELGVEHEDRIIKNVERSILLADLMSNDPIIRDADPTSVAEIYKSIVKSSPRISLDKALVRSVLRNAVNSVAVSPSDVKVLTDVDKGVALANIERLSNLDSSIKDSNRA